MAKDYIREGLNKMRQLMKESFDTQREMDDVMAMIASDDMEKPKLDDDEDKYKGLEPGDDIEDDSEKLETVPYTKNDELLSSITQTCKERFGANFTKSKTPMLYYPKDGDVTLTGEISSLNNAVFQFRYKDSTGNGCYLWIEPVNISDETIRIMSIINGIYKNWKNELSTSEDIKPMSMRDSGTIGGDDLPEPDEKDEGREENGPVPGDDMD
jgi:hypothetical protein